MRSKYLCTNNKDAQKYFREYIIEACGKEVWNSWTIIDKRCAFLDWVDFQIKDGQFPPRANDWYYHA